MAQSDIVKNYINGELVAPLSGQYLDLYEPATGAVYSQVADSGEADVESAFESAQAAFSSWSESSSSDRSKVLSRIADLIDENLDMLAEAEARDNGKPFWLAKQVDIPRASSNFRFIAHAATQFAS
ncbi:MAG: aldehyde dehydrogenase family protein, partial [Bacteroidota bacterium]